MEVHGTKLRISLGRLLSALAVAVTMFTAAAGARAQPARFDDVVRNLRNPDPKVRLSAVRLLREAKYPESTVPMSALVSDPLDPIQLEAIAAELSFFLVQDVPEGAGAPSSSRCGTAAGRTRRTSCDGRGRASPC